MADITKCMGEIVIENKTHVCDLRKKCYRYLAPSSVNQSYSILLTIRESENKEPVQYCEYKWIVKH